MVEQQNDLVRHQIEVHTACLLYSCHPKVQRRDLINQPSNSDDEPHLLVHTA